MKIRSTVLPALTLILAAGLAGCGGDTDDSSSATESPTDHSTMDMSESAEASEPADEESESAEAPEPSGNVVAITIAGGEITPEPGVVSVPLNEEVTIEITSDIADEIHVHGYDKEFELEPGGTASVTFMADIPGVFEIETHESGDLLAELKVE
jgi:hypothetical protein